VPNAVLVWWLFLCAVAAVNVAAWLYSARHLSRQRPTTPPEIHALRVRLSWLAAVYVAGCAFRSVLPMIDASRFCLHDTWMSRIVVGRSIATVAELSVAAQLALVLRVAGTAAGGGLAVVASRFVLPVIALAEVFSWAAVLRRDYLLHAIENSLWTLMAFLALAAFVSIRARRGTEHRRLLTFAIACASGYIAYMLLIDVPMYIGRWQANLALHRHDLSIQAGLQEILQRCTVVRTWTTWRQEVSWLSLYFTVAVWISLSLAHLPLIGGGNHPRPGK
jgi:hypothetical protein